MEVNFDIETDKLFKILNEMSKNTPKLIKQHLKKVGKSFQSSVKKSVKTTIKNSKLKKQSNKRYLNRFKVSRVLENTGNFAIGVYNSSPHAHLIEYGYNITTKGSKRVVGFKKGRFPIKKAVINFENKELKENLENMLENVIKDGGF